MSDMKLEQVVIKSDAHRTMKKTKKLFAIAREAVQPVDVTLANLRSDREGLTHAEAAARLKQYGPNEVAQEKAPPALIGI